MSQPTVARKELPSTQPLHRPSDSTSSQQQQQQQQLPYHDDPSLDNGRPLTPPPYSGPSTPIVAGPSQPPTEYIPRPSYYPGLPRLDYSLYLPSHYDFELSSDKTTISSHSALLSKSPVALLPLLQALTTIPPKPVVRIQGKNQNGMVDFDVRINCMNLIYSDEEKARMNYVKVIGPGERGWRGEAKQTLTPTLMGLEQWVKRFCDDRGAIKEFAVERTIINWDTSYIEGRLLSLVNSTNYRGHTAVSFDLSHSKVVVHSPDKYNRFFSNVTKAFTGSKKYEVVKSVWPYADVGREEGSAGRGRRCLVQDEDRWFAEWRSVVRYAVLGRRKGWVTGEDRLEELMEPRVAPDGEMPEWGLN